ncbi:alanine--tRNA ligase [Salibacteraceae bacterium]|nr:alanine--tRNA ligase [Salibacteraceae bacterium]MDB9709485.1 alanine--tRNA ligase [Salibacteraceae bacterium]MDC1304736.1 alanine--tRNA ligase [Salibacteraceae bacterium]
MEWTTRKVRSRFQEYFKEKGHHIVDSAPIVIKDDPTLMFTNAGMNQFKSIFVGNEEKQYPRIADTQKCLRVSGKHNDLEEVGRDHYHHTMFEMLGNWSFGDYFKKDAINYAWELLVDVYGLDKDRLYVSIFAGDEELGVEVDNEAEQLWLKHIPSERILKFGRKENFWEMGETGPCGPCSEIHVDLRSEEQRKKVDGRTLVNMDDPEVIEIWNLVFMQFNRLENGKLETLKDKHIDTGMGLERLVRVLQGVSSNYDTDIFVALIKSIEEESGIDYKGSADLSDVAFRVIADHVRAVSFCIADGQLPSNTGAGYVIRRVLRRAIRYGFSQLNMKEPFINKVVIKLIEEMGADFPELTRNRELLTKVVREEEISFLSTLEKGLEKLNVIFQSEGEKIISGDVAFELYDTYGFPIDLTNLIASENNWKVDMKGFSEALETQKNRSRSATKTSFGDWTVLNEGANSSFLGYDQLSCTTKIAKYRSATVKGKEVVQIVLVETPFYAESGGQVGDTGKLLVDGQEIQVVDTKKENNEIIHFISEMVKNISADVEASVNVSRRTDIKKNHSSTHLLHFALRSILGAHVEQKGSLVSPDKLRFDFSHFERISEDQIKEIETLVRDQIESQVELQEWRKMPINEAKEMGAMALFGEKYGNEVRVVKFGDSVELCGGIHVDSTSEIGGFKIISESSVASGVRRVEALTGRAYTTYISNSIDLIEKINDEMGRPKQLLASIQKLQTDYKAAQKLIENFEQVEKSRLRDSLLSAIQVKGDRKMLIQLLKGIDGKAAKDTVYSLTLEVKDLMVVLAGEYESKPYLIVGISKELAERENLDASKMVREIASEIDGGGGGQKFLAMAGGKNSKGLQRALDRAESLT